jgi:riboflavin biosynthesis pyrimidine reductase
MRPLQVLFQRDREARTTRGLRLPAGIEQLYGGGLTLGDEAVYVNMVTTLDGVAALPGTERSSAMIAGGSEADRFVMGLLRACADVVLIGAGTLRAHPRSLWTPKDAYPAGADGFEEVRRLSGLPPAPRVAVLTTTGRLGNHPVLDAGALVLAPEGSARRVRESVPDASAVVPIEGEEIGRAVVTALRRHGFERVLTEGGPTLLGALFAAEAIESLFLTVSPLLAGRGAEHRPGLADGHEFLPAAAVRLRLESLRTDGSHLFTRYERA